MHLQAPQDSANPNMRHQRAQIPQRIYEAVGVSGWWLARTIAEKCRVDVSCAQKHLKRLHDCGLLARAKAKGKATKPRYVYMRKAA